MKDEERLPNSKRANTSLEKEKREKQKFSKMKKSVMENTIKKENLKLLTLKAGITVNSCIIPSFFFIDNNLLKRFFSQSISCFDSTTTSLLLVTFKTYTKIVTLYPCSDLNPATNIGFNIKKDRKLGLFCWFEVFYVVYGGFPFK